MFSTIFFVGGGGPSIIIIMHVGLNHFDNFLAS